MIPGLANNFALLLAGLTPAAPTDPLLVGTAIPAAGVPGTFLDVIPALAYGVSDTSVAVAALPGHRLMIAGRGREGLQISAVGSGLAVALALPFTEDARLSPRRSRRG